MSPALSTFLLEAVNFLILAAGLGWLFFRPVRRAIAAEQETHRKIEETAASQRAEAERMRAEAERQRAGLGEELERLRAEARAGATQEAARILARARAETEREREQARRELEGERSASAAALGDQIAALSAEAILGLLGWLEGPELEVALGRAAIRALGAAPQGPLVIESAHPLGEQERRALGAMLDGATVEYRVRDSLGTGLRILSPSGLVDASAAGLAEHARRILGDRLKAGLEPRHG